MPKDITYTLSDETVEKLQKMVGEHLYQHSITIERDDEEYNYNFTLVILNDTNQTLTYNDILNFLINNDFIVTYHYDESTQETTYTGNSYSLGVSGGMGGATGEGSDNAFAFDLNYGKGTSDYVIAFDQRNQHGITNYMDTSNEATVTDIVIPIF